MVSVSLVGMPGAGKSTVGVLLAKLLGCNFVDTDLLIQVREGKTLQEIIATQGYQALRSIEESVILQGDFDNAVVSTGGSAVYSEPAMRQLATFGPVVFIDVKLKQLRERLGDYAARGIAMRPDQSLQDLFDERNALYRSSMTMRVDGALPAEQVAIKIAQSL